VVLSSQCGRYGNASEGSMPPGLNPGGDPAGMPPSEDEGDEDPDDKGSKASRNSSARPSQKEATMSTGTERSPEGFP
jgi:hypothetical protein